MNEQGNYWLSLIDAADQAVKPLKAGGAIPDEMPPWAGKLVRELMNLMMPKSPMKPGMKLTPKLVGQTLGWQFVCFTQMKSSPGFGPVVSPGVQYGLDVASRSAAPQFDMPTAIKNAQMHTADVEAKLRALLVNVLAERPFNEAVEFFQGFAIGLRNNSASLVPEMVDGKPQFTERQMQRIRTLGGYWIAFLHWKELDRLQSSKEAFEFLAAKMPEQILGYDPERIRKMFYRLGKKFKEPGRPPEAGK